MYTPHIPDILQPVRSNLLRSVTTFTEVIPFETPTSQTASLIGSNGFKLQEDLHPKDLDGERMILLAQVNFNEFDFPLSFPLNGLLQFYMSKRCINMQEQFSGIVPKQYFKVVYTENISMNTMSHDRNTEELPATFPIQGTQSLQFKNNLEIIPLEDFRFKQFLSTHALKVLFQNKDFPFEEYYAQHYSSASQKIGGYPFFINQDFRAQSTAYEHLDTLLLQLVSDDEQGIMWGDSGVIHFFINYNDLIEKRFENTILHVEDYSSL